MHSWFAPESPTYKVAGFKFGKNDSGRARVVEGKIQDSLFRQPGSHIQKGMDLDP
jgi:hypothetical protein